MSEKILLPKSAHRQCSTFHTKRDCPYLNQSDTGIVTREKQHIDGWGKYSLCQWCDEDQDGPGGSHPDCRTPLRTLINKGEVDAAD